MPDLKEINTIEQLRFEKERLRGEMKMTEQAIKQSLRRTRDAAKDFAINKLLIPAGLTAFATYIIQQWNKDPSDQVEMAEAEAHPPLWQSLLTALAEFLLNFFKIAIQRRQDTRSAETADGSAKGSA